MQNLVTKHQFIRKLDLGSLEIFILICQMGSIGGAAKKSHLAISSVSKRVNELEKLTRSKLLTRKSKGVEPTEAGLCLLKHAKDILLSIEYLRINLDDFFLGKNEYVHIYASASVVEQSLAQEIASFAKDSPEVSIDLSQAPSREVIQAVREGYADIGICDSSEIYSDLASRAYRKEELVLIVPTNHPLASHKKLAFSQALDYDLIGVYGSSMIQQLLEKAASSSGHILRQRIKVSSLSALCRMVESGLGIGVIPYGAIHLLSKKGSFCTISLTDEWSKRELMLFAKSFDMLTPAAARFSNYLSH